MPFRGGRSSCRPRSNCRVPAQRARGSGRRRTELRAAAQRWRPGVLLAPQQCGAGSSRRPPWTCTAPPHALDLRYRPDALKNPGVYTGVVSAGPAIPWPGRHSGWSTPSWFRLSGERIETDPAQIPAGGQRRLFFRAEAGRPFFVATATTSRTEQARGAFSMSRWRAALS